DDGGEGSAEFVANARHELLLLAGSALAVGAGLAGVLSAGREEAPGAVLAPQQGVNVAGGQDRDQRPEEDVAERKPAADEGGGEGEAKSGDEQRLHALSERESGLELVAGLAHDASLIPEFPRGAWGY